MDVNYSNVHIDTMRELFDSFQRDETSEDQFRCWGMVKDIFCYRVNRLVENNLFIGREVESIGSNLIERSVSLFSDKEKAFVNSEKIRLAFNKVFGIDVKTSSDVTVKGPDYIAPDGSEIYLISN